MDTGKVIEDRPVSESTGRERRREFRGGARNLTTSFIYEAIGETAPHQWKCGECEHKGWMKVTGSCGNCGGFSKMLPTKLPDLYVVHNHEDGKTYAWDDVTGNELDPKLTMKARMEEIEQFKKHQVYEKS